MNKENYVDKILTTMKIPAERGFSCMEASRCELCIKAAELKGETTPCEDDLEIDVNKQLEYSAMGIYDTPHISNQDKDYHQVYRAWIKLLDGGIMGIPYPAKNIIEAIRLADKAALLFGGDNIHVERLGKIYLK